jgi:hypothetical protein
MFWRTASEARLLVLRGCFLPVDMMLDLEREEKRSLVLIYIDHIRMGDTFTTLNPSPSFIVECIQGC